jgi:hypothetical protein
MGQIQSGDAQNIDNNKDADFDHASVTGSVSAQETASISMSDRNIHEQFGKLLTPTRHRNNKTPPHGRQMLSVDTEDDNMAYTSNNMSQLSAYSRNDTERGAHRGGMPSSNNVGFAPSGRHEGDEASDTSTPTAIGMLCDVCVCVCVCVCQVAMKTMRRAIHLLLQRLVCCCMTTFMCVCVFVCV